MGSPFSSRFLYWVGLDFASSDPADVARFNRFYDETHAPEVIAFNPGFTYAHRYALEVPDPRGDVGAEYLAAYELDGEQAAAGYLARDAGLESKPGTYSSDPPLWPDLLGTRWRVLYECIAQTSEPAASPGGILIIGIDPPADIDEDGLAEFDTYYSEVHLPEVTDAGGFTRGSRYEMRHALAHPEPGCPRYLAVYELADGSPGSIDAARRRLRTACSTQGPDSWRRHLTPWRLWYRSISVGARATSLDRATISQRR